MNQVTVKVETAEEIHEREMRAMRAAMIRKMIIEAAPAIIAKAIRQQEAKAVAELRYTLFTPWYVQVWHKIIRRRFWWQAGGAA